MCLKIQHLKITFSKIYSYSLKNNSALLTKKVMACQKKVWDQTQKVKYQGALDPGQTTLEKKYVAGKFIYK